MKRRHEVARAHWEGDSIIVTPTNGARNIYPGLQAVKLAPLTAWGPSGVRLRLFKAVLVWGSGKEEPAQMIHLNMIFSQQSEAWRLWVLRGKSPYYTAQAHRVIEWLEGGKVIHRYPRLLEPREPKTTQQMELTL